jgi:hypothetical protein
LCIFNFFYHINIPFSFDAVSFNNSTICYYVNDESRLIVSYMDLVNFVLLPFLLMICFSSLLIGSIYKVRKRVRLNNSGREKKRIRRDIKFAISLLSMNLLFILLNLPLEIDLFLPYYNNNDIYAILTYVFYLSYAVNFYCVLFTNSLIRKEFFYLFKNEKINQITTRKITIQPDQNQPRNAETAF